MARFLQFLLCRDLKINSLPVNENKTETGALTSKVIPHENSNERSFQLQEIVKN
jgi:hypothetical protein